MVVREANIKVGGPSYQMALPVGCDRLRGEIEKRERGDRECEKRQRDEKYSRFDELFGSRESEEKQKRK